MRALWDGDMVIGWVTGVGEGVPVPVSLLGLPQERLRYDGEAVVDAADYSLFYVDPQGRKHITEGDGRQALACEWDDPLVLDGGTWRLESEADRSARARRDGARRVDALAEEARLQFITPGAGQALVYENKRREAEDCLAEVAAAQTPDPQDYPLLAAEVGITAEDLVAVATVVAGLAAQWRTVAAYIEALRLGAKAAIDAVTDGPTAAAEVEAIIASLSWPPGPE